jgi:hypothetical protein
MYATRSPVREDGSPGRARTPTRAGSARTHPAHRTSAVQRAVQAVLAKAVRLFGGS